MILTIFWNIVSVKEFSSCSIKSHIMSSSNVNISRCRPSTSFDPKLICIRIVCCMISINSKILFCKLSSMFDWCNIWKAKWIFTANIQIRNFNYVQRVTCFISFNRTNNCSIRPINAFDVMISRRGCLNGAKEYKHNQIYNHLIK